MRTLASSAGPIDMGPTVFTMRFVFEELFEMIGERLSDHLDLDRASILARHHWPDGSSVDLPADLRQAQAAIEAFAGAEDGRAFAAFSERAKLLFNSFEQPFMRAERPTMGALIRATATQRSRTIRAMAPLSTLWGTLGRQFRDVRLQQLFGRYATYVGGSPFLTPATLLLIWHAEASGVWTVRGGMNRIAQVLHSLARARGARFRFDSRVAEIEVRDGHAAGVVLANGEALDADAILFNGDPAALAAGLLGRGAAPAARKVSRRKRSLSAMIWTFDAQAAQCPLIRHTVFFGGPSRDEFRTIFRARSLPRDPAIYVCAQDRPGNDAPSPDGLERFLVLVNAPPDGDLNPIHDDEARQCTERTFQRLAEAGLRLPIPSREALTTPTDMDRAFPGSGGAIYGRAPHGALGTFARPVATSPIPGLYLAGGGVHPGPGVPMAALSGRHAASAILRDRASIRRFHPGATPGGTSTPSRTMADTG